MRLLRLALEGFRSHDALDLDLSAVESAAILGANGSGKSSLLVGVTWALYGGGGAEDHVRDGATRMRVTLEVAQAGERYRVARGRERGKGGWLTLERADGSGWASLTQRTVAETQERIVEYLTGMDGDAWAATVYAPQGQAGMLASLTPARRKELLGGLLGLDRYEPWRERAAGEARAARVRQAEHDTRLHDLTAQVDRLAGALPDPAELQARHDAATTRVGEAQAAVDAAVEAERVRAQVALRRSVEGEMAAVKARADAAKRAATRREEIDAQLAELEGADDRLAGLEAQLRVAQSAADAADATLRSAQRDAERAVHALRAAETARKARDRELTQAQDAQRAASAELSALDGQDAACPTCGGALHSDALQRARDSLAATATAADTRASEAMKASEAAERDVTAARTELEEANGALERCPPIEPRGIVHGLQQARAASRTAARLDGERAGLQSTDELHELRDQYRQLRERAHALPDAAPDAPDATTARGEVARAHDLLRAVEADQVRAQEMSGRLDELRGGVRDLEARTPALARDALAYEVAARAFGREGIPALILDNAVGAVEAAANELLERFDVGLRIRLATQRTTKTGGAAETLDLIVDDGVNERPLERFSGGERYRVHLALRIGLAHALAGVGGPRCDALLLDEPTDLDSEGMVRLGEMLAAWPGQSLVVTHTEALAHALPTAIRVQRAAGAASEVVVG